MQDEWLTLLMWRCNHKYVKQSESMLLPTTTASHFYLKVENVPVGKCMNKYWSRLLQKRHRALKWNKECT